MSRQGGEADKLGNRYEAAWTTQHALLCLSSDDCTLSVEDIDPQLNNGSEFTYVEGARIEIHQLKRSTGKGNAWSLKALAAQDVFASAAGHVSAGREYHFVSTVPCGELQELADRARKAESADQYVAMWLTSQSLRRTFDELSAPEHFGSAEAAWRTLRGMWFEVQSELTVIRTNVILAESQLEGANGHLIGLAIHDILLSTLGRRIGKKYLLDQLAERDITPRTVGSRATLRHLVTSATDSWLNTVRSELLQPVIERSEAAALIETLSDKRLCLVAGTAGGGKSAVLEQAVASLKTDGAEVMAFRLDRFDAFASTAELGRQLGFETSPVSALANAADGSAAYLVIDQLDAVSLASGRMPRSFDVVTDLINEALLVPGLRVVMACREFDIDNDHRIRALATRKDLHTLKIAQLSDEQVNAAVLAMGLEPAALTARQRKLLQVPVHLVLLQTIADQDDALSFHSRGSLFQLFWDRKQQECDIRRPGVRFAKVIARVANAASDRQMLSVPIEVLDEGDLRRHADVLVSEHVLARDGDRVAFFHESFFDYAFARHWVSRGQSMVEFLTSDEQELFRRGQVRQILNHLREREPARFRAELEEVLLSDSIRYHVKDAALAVLGDLSQPTSEELQLVLRVQEAKPVFEERLWRQVERASWFSRFNEDGVISEWLDGDDQERRNRAASILSVATHSFGEDVARLLETRQEADDYSLWLRYTARQADLHENRAIFDLFIEGVRRGLFDAADHEMWLVVHELAKKQPVWAIELLQARLIDHVDALSLDAQGKVAYLASREYTAVELVKQASSDAPREFARTMVPYLRDVVAATLYESREGRPSHDKHFGMRWPEEDQGEHELDEAIIAGCVRSMRKLAESDIEGVQDLLDTLAADPWDTSQYLLFQTLIAAGASRADWAADLLLEGGLRLQCGYASDADWVSRELAKAVAPHIDDDKHQRLEDLFRDLRSEYESRAGSGRMAFTFLSALVESRLSELGHRRLEEYRRKFNQSSPEPPRGITGGTVVSPIGDTATSKMTDDQWLGAMRRYAQDEHDWDTFRGGAHELSSSLRARVAAEPDRFARLALRMTEDLNSAYADAILMGLGDAPELDADGLFAAIRHIASFKKSQNDRWLGMALRRHYRAAPLDIVELILDRTLHSADPSDDRPVVIRGDGDGRRAEDLRMNGINTARGSLAEALGDLLIHDTDGSRTELVRPHLDALASDPVLSVRSCVAHTLAASLLHARPDVLPAFRTLIDTDDVILAAQLVLPLMLYIGNVEPEAIDPVIQRMLTSDNDEARDAGGQLAAFAALEWERPEVMTQALVADAHVRVGVARTCAGRIDRTTNADLATEALVQLMNDESEDVRKAVAQVAPHLRDQALRPFASLLTALIASASYDESTPQLLITLQHAPDRVDDLVLLAAQRFLAVFGEDAADIRTGAAGDAHYISELVVRGLAQSSDRKHRSDLLDVVDGLLLRGVYGIGEAISDSERL